MKALKEKRINLRSLWRRSLVVLSLLALSFALAACGSSDDGDGGDAGGAVTPSRVPSSAILLDFPFQRDLWLDGQGGVMGLLEGMPVNLEGTAIQLTYTDGLEPRTRVVYYSAATSHMFSIDPPFYTLHTDPQTFANAPNRNHLGRGIEVGAVVAETTRGFGPTQHTLTLVTGVSAFNFTITNDTVRNPLHDAAMGHVQPLIHVDLVGNLLDRDFFVDEVPSFPAGMIFQGVWGTVHAGQGDWHRARLPNPSYYHWRWVFNEPGFAGQRPGLLMQFATWGDVRGDGTDPSGGPIFTIPGEDPWTGLRIPVRNIWQVESITFDPPDLNWGPDPIFFDDPTLFGMPGEGWSFENWTRGVLGGNTMVVTYVGAPGSTPPEPRRFPFSEFGHFETAPEDGWGVWSAPVLRFYTGTIALGNRACVTTRPDDNLLGWSNWLVTANQRITIYYRSAAPVEIRVPFFNALASISVEPIPGVELVVLNGFDVVDFRQEGQAEFLSRVVVTGHYTHNLTDETTTRNIQEALATGRMRGAITPPANNAATAPSAGNPLFGLNGSVANMAAGTIAPPAGAPANTGFALATSIHAGGTALSHWMNPTIFTERNSNLFNTAGTTRNIRVEVQPQLLGTGTAQTTRPARNAVLAIGLLNY